MRPFGETQSKAMRAYHTIVESRVRLTTHQTSGYVTKIDLRSKQVNSDKVLFSNSIHSILFEFENLNLSWNHLTIVEFQIG